jgi:hypothetical protein
VPPGNDLPRCSRVARRADALWCRRSRRCRGSLCAVTYPRHTAACHTSSTGSATGACRVRTVQRRCSCTNSASGRRAARPRSLVGSLPGGTAPPGACCWRATSTPSSNVALKGVPRQDPHHTAKPLPERVRRGSGQCLTSWSSNQPPRGYRRPSVVVRKDEWTADLPPRCRRSNVWLARAARPVGRAATRVTTAERPGEECELQRVYVTRLRVGVLDAAQASGRSLSTCARRSDVSATGAPRQWGARRGSWTGYPRVTRAKTGLKTKSH